MHPGREVGQSVSELRASVAAGDIDVAANISCFLRVQAERSRLHDRERRRGRRSDVTARRRNSPFHPIGERVVQLVMRRQRWVRIGIGGAVAQTMGHACYEVEAVEALNRGDATHLVRNAIVVVD